MNDVNYKFFLKAKEFLKENKYSEAVAILRGIHRLEPNDMVNNFELGRLLTRNSNTLQEGKEILLQMENDEYAMLELGRLGLKAGNNDKARYYFERLLNTKNKLYAMLELGRLELKEGNSNKARYYFEYLLNTKNKLYAMLELGRLELKEENNDKARYYFEHLLNTKNNEYAMLELGKLELKEGNNDKARYYFEHLLNTKNNEYAMLELGKLEAKERNNDKARYYFKHLLNKKNKEYAKDELLFLNISEGKYKEAYELLNSIPNYTDKIVYANAKDFLEYNLGISDRASNNRVNYFNSQLYNYDENKTLYHISKHLDENDKKKVHTVFYSDIDLRELLLMVKDKIKNAIPNRSTTVDKYIVRYDDYIATIDSDETQYLEVVTFPNTKNIITMYPILAPLNELDKPKQLKRRK